MKYLSINTLLCLHYQIIYPFSEAYRGALSNAELDALDRAAAVKSQAIQHLLAREQELCDIRDGNITANKVCLSFNDPFIDPSIHSDTSTTDSLTT